jgi:hypothetical protein
MKILLADKVGTNLIIMKLHTGTSYNVFNILPFMQFVSERDLRDGSFAYAYLAIGWGYWSIDIVFKEEEYNDDKDFFEYD